MFHGLIPVFHPVNLDLFVVLNPRDQWSEMNFWQNVELNNSFEKLNLKENPTDYISNS